MGALNEARTPCQEAPEAWVGDNDALRREAAAECLTCPVLDACRRAVAADPTLRFGAIAGVDYGDTSTRAKAVRTVQAGSTETRVCDQCQVTFPRRSKESPSQWAERRFCSRACTGKFQREEFSRTHGIPAEKDCPRCGVTFGRPENRSPAQWLAQQFCSASCANRRNGRIRVEVAA